MLTGPHLGICCMWVTGFKLSKEYFWRNIFQGKVNFVHIFFLTCLSMINTVIGIFTIHIGNRRSITGGWPGMGLWVIYCFYIKKFGMLGMLLIICYETNGALHCNWWSDIAGCLTFLRYFPVNLEIPLCSVALV